MTETSAVWFHVRMLVGEYKPKLLRDLLQVHAVVLLDGAWGTVLGTQYPALAAHPARAVLEFPDSVISLAGDYESAGALALTTNTFRASPWLMGTDFASTNRAAVALALQVRPQALMGSIGPARLEARRAGMLAAEDDGWLRDQFLQQASALAHTGCRTVILETFGALDECLLAMDAVREAGIEEVLCSLYVDSETEAPACLPGDSISLADAMKTLADAGTDLLGLNCIAGPDVALSLLQTLEMEKLGVPFAIQPNAGTPCETDGAWVHPIAAKRFGDYAVQLREAGARLIGGCCGTTPEHVAASRRALYG